MVKNIKSNLSKIIDNLQKDTSTIKKNIISGITEADKYAKNINELINMKHEIEALYNEVNTNIGKYSQIYNDILADLNKYKRVDSKIKDTTLKLENINIYQAYDDVSDNTKNLSILARRVRNWKDAEMGDNGILYYVEPSDQFVLKINGQLFYGNIGTIFSNNSSPTKIKTCKYNKSCTKNYCTYYHDPRYNSQSKDIRNYMASSWIYNSNTPDKKIRRFGSRYKMRDDITQLNDEEYERFRAQTMHEILCSIILGQNYQSNTSL